jgi:hypothetical protein
MAAVNALLLGSLLHRARLVPRRIPALGLVGAPLLLAASTAGFFGVIEQVSASGGGRDPAGGGVGAVGRDLDGGEGGPRGSASGLSTARTVDGRPVNRAGIPWPVS